MLNLFLGACIVLAIMIYFCLYRAYVGPTAADRVMAINIIGTKTVVIIALISYIFLEGYFLDIALAYALISFITTIGVAKYLEKGALE